MDKYDDTVCKLVHEKLIVQEAHNNEIMKLESDLHKEQEHLSNSEKQFAELHTYEYETWTCHGSKLNGPMTGLSDVLQDISPSLGRNFPK